MRGAEGGEWAALALSSSTAQARAECPDNRHNGGCRRNVRWRGRTKGAAETSSRRTIGGGNVAVIETSLHRTASGVRGQQHFLTE